MAPRDGRMTWAQAMAGPLAGATCLWQDLDGVHVEPPPSSAPPTSILRAWRDDSLLVRLRLDGQTAYVALHDPPSQSLVPTVAWSREDGRVIGSVRPGLDQRGVGTGARYEQAIVDGAAGGPITFVRPARGA